MPTKDDLELENLVRSNAKLKLEINILENSKAKLQLETEKLEKDLRISPALPLLISMLSAMAAAIGLGFSAFSQAQQSKSQQTQEDHRTAQDTISSLHAAAEMATDSHAPADRRISGIYQLRHFWKSPEQVDVTAATLTAILASGDAAGYARVRCAAAAGIGDAIGAPEQGWVHDSPKEQARREYLSHLLYGYGSKGQRGLVSDLNERLRWAAAHPPAQKEGEVKNGSEPNVRLPTSSDDDIQCNSAIGATIEAIRQNWEQLRDVNLAATTLDYAELYQADLAHTNLKLASLVGTNLQGANLAGADFGGATGYDQPTAPTRLKNANVLGLVGQSGSFCRFASAHGAVQMSDADWKAWRAAGFPANEAGPLGVTYSKPQCSA